MQQLGLPPQAAGSDAGSGLQLIQSAAIPRDQRIARIFTRRHAENIQAIR